LHRAKFNYFLGDLMGIEEVKDEILNNARTKAKEILRLADAEKEGIQKSAQTRVSQIRDELDSEAAKQIEQYKTVTLAEAHSTVKKKRLAIEAEILDETYNDILGKLSKLNAKKREQHLKKILSQTKEYPKVYASKKDLALLKGHRPEQADISGGLIVEDKNTEIRLDVSYETLIADIKRDHISDIAKILFRE
jgi:vacuolar-type H+-ATPase subunit E/Vma4